MNRVFDHLTLPKFASPNRNRPALVAIEGPNGVGKSTLCANFQRLWHIPSARGVDDAWLVDAFKERMIRDAEWFSSSLFFLSGCLEQLRMLSLRPDPLILLDRCLWSTLAVHAAHDTSRLAALVRMLAPISNQIQIPDLTLVLDASFDTCLTRIAQKSGPARDLDELTANKTFYQREQAFYQWLQPQLPNCRFLNVDDCDANEAADRAHLIIQQFARC